MLFLGNVHVRNCERILAYNIAGIASDLRELDAADLVAWLRGNRYGNVAALISSSTELSFKPGTIRFAFGGSAKVTWSGAVEMRLDMEFRHRSVACYFQLQLCNAYIGVAITYLDVEGQPCRSARDVEEFRISIGDATRVRNAVATLADRVERKLGANEAE